MYVVSAMISLTALGLFLGLMLSLAARFFKVESSPIVDELEALMPGSQCGQCGYPGCRPYAQAIVDGTADINLCPPGGDDTVRRLASLLGREPLPLAEAPPEGRVVAVIDEAVCIGCTHCRAACPVDAIVGAHQLMHTVIESECTGCELCIAPCPVDCISLRSAS